MKSENSLRRLLNFIGMDRAVAYVILARGWTTLAGMITLYSVVHFLKLEEQGFYYTFSSVLGIQIFFELGFSYTLMQCVSHEKAHLEWTRHGTVEGSAKAKDRLAALLRVAIRWYGTAAVLFFVGVLPAGLIFFRESGAAHPAVTWRLPWVWLATAESLMLFVSPFFVFLEGAGLVAQIALVRLATSIMVSLALWTTLWSGWALLASPVVSTVGCLSSACWIVGRYRRYFLDLLRMRPEPGIFSWRAEVWPFQWRITLSWLSGYFLSQVAIPIVFRYQGTTAAGQFGLSMSLVLAAQAIGMAWVSTKVPQFGYHVARREFKALDALFFRTFKQALPILILVGGVLFSAVIAVNILASPYRLRVLPPLPFAFLLGRMLLDFSVYFIAVYLRAHKQEPFVAYSAFSAILVAGSTYISGRFYGVAGVAAGNFVITLACLPFAIIIFVRKRKLWHAPLEPAAPELE